MKAARNSFSYLCRMYHCSPFVFALELIALKIKMFLVQNAIKFHQQIKYRETVTDFIKFKKIYLKKIFFETDDSPNKII